MRKRGKPNPDQKYFSLVVGLHADTADDSFLVVAHVSERIIVRASNPGNFDNDCDYSWFKASNPEHIYHQGRVGINTEKPDEALSVHGNIQLTGQILQASDMRIKKNVKQLHSSSKKHLENISRLQLYEYQLATATSGGEACCTSSPEFTRKTGSPDLHRLHSQTVDVAYIQGDGAHGNNSHDDVTSNREIIHGNGTVFHSNDNGSHGNIASHHSDDQECRRKGKERKIVGLLAQEVKTVLPNAVIQTEQQVELSDGEIVENLLVVDKDQVLMEVLGAVQELENATNNHRDRLQACEKRPHFGHSDARTAQTANIRMTIHKEQEDSKPFLHRSTELTLSVRATTLQWLILALALIIFGCSISIFS